jgi:hypothetical protein
MASIAVSVVEVLGAIAGPIPYAPEDDVTLVDTGAAVAGLTVAEIADLAAVNVDAIDSSTDVLTLTPAQFNALGSVALTPADDISVIGAPGEIEALDPAALGAKNVDRLAAFGPLTFTAAHAQALLANGLALSGTITITGSMAEITGFTAAQLDQLSVVLVDPGDAAVVSAAEAQTLIDAGVIFDVSDTATVTGTSAALLSMSVAALENLGVATLDSSDPVSLTTVQAQGLIDANIGFDAGNSVTLTGTSAALLAMDVGALETLGVDAMNASQPVSLTNAQAQALINAGIAFDAGNSVVVTGTSAELLLMTTAQLTALHVDVLGASDALSLTAERAAELIAAGIRCESARSVTVTGTSTELLAIATGDLASLGVDVLDASDPVSITAGRAAELILANIAFDSGNGVTVTGSEAELLVLDPAELATLGVGILDGSGPVSLTTLEAQSLIDAGIVFDVGDVVTVTGSTAQLLAMDVAQLDALGADVLDSSDDVVTISNGQFAALLAADISFHVSDTILVTGGGVLSPTVAEYRLLGPHSYAGSDVVTLTDSAANIASLTVGEIAALAGKNVDALHATGGAFALSVAQFEALGTVILTETDTVTLSGTAAELTAYPPADLAAAHIDLLDASEPVTITAEQAGDMLDQGIGFVPGNNVTVTGTAEELLAFTPADLAGMGVDVLAADAAVTVDATQTADLVAAGLRFAAGDSVTLIDTGAAIAALTDAEFAALAVTGIDTIDAGDDVLTLTVGQFGGLGAVALTADDEITLTGAPGALLALDPVTLAAAHVDLLDATAPVTLDHLQARAILESGLVFSEDDTVTVAGPSADLLSFVPAQLASMGVDALDASDLVALTADQAGDLMMAGIHFVAADSVTLSDTGASIALLTPAQIEGLHDLGVDSIDASDDALSLTLDQFDQLTGVTLTVADTVTLTGTAQDLMVRDPAALAAAHVDVLDASDAVTLSAAHGAAMVSAHVRFAAGNTVSLVDSSESVSALTAEQIGGLSEAGVDTVDVTDDSLLLSVDQATALGSVALAASDVVVVRDSEANIAGLTAEQIAILSAKGVSLISASDGALHLDVAQFRALGTIGLEESNATTLLDSGGHLASLTPTEITSLAGKGIDAVDAADDGLALTVEQFQALGSVVLAAGDSVTLADEGGNIEALDAATLGRLAGAGIDAVDATDDGLSFTAARAAALGTITIAAGDTAVLDDTGAGIAALSAAQIADIADSGFDSVDANDDVLALTVAQFQARGSMVLSAGDAVTLADAGATLGSLAVGELAALGAARVDGLDATDDALTLTVAKYQALEGVQLTTGDTVTLGDTGANLAGMTGAAIGALGAAGVDVLDATNDSLTLNVDKATALGDVVLVTGDATLVSDTGAALGALSAAQIGALDRAHVDRLDSTTNSLTVSVAQLNALGSTVLTGSDAVTLRDTGSTLDALSAADIAALAGKRVDVLDASDNVLALSLAQYQALGTVTLRSTDTVTLADAGDNLAALTPARMSLLASRGIDRIDATDDALTLSLAQFQALGSIQLTGGDTVTLADTGASLAAMSAGAIGALEAAGIDRLDATDDVLSLTAARAAALGSVVVDAGDSVTLADSGAAIGALTAAQIADIAGSGVDRIDSTDNTLTLTVAKYQALGAMALTGGDLVTLADSGANLAGLSAAAVDGLAAAGVDRLDATDNTLAITVAQYQALGAVQLTGADAITLADSGAQLATLSANQIGALAAAGIDRVDATDDALSLTVAQYQALGTAALTAGDDVTLTDTGAQIASLSDVGIGALAGDGIDVVDASDDRLSLTVAEYQALGSVVLVAGDTVTLGDAGANLQGLDLATVGGLAAAHVDELDATDDRLSLSVEAYQALGGVRLAAGDSVTLTDTAAHLGGLSAAEIGALAAAGVDQIDAFDHVLSLDAARAAALGSVTAVDEAEVLLADSGAHIADLTAAQIADIADSGVDAIDATDDDLVLNVAQFSALGGMALAAGDDVTLRDTGAALAALDLDVIAGLEAANVDQVDASDDELVISFEQLLVWGAVALTGDDTVTLSGTGLQIGAFDAAGMAALDAAGFDRLDASDDEVQLAADQLLALGDMMLAAEDAVTLADSGANVMAMTADELSAMASAGVDSIDVTDDVLSLTLSQFRALDGVELALGDTITLGATGSFFGQMDTGELAGLAGAGIDAIDAIDDTLALSLAAYQALGNVSITAEDSFTLTDTGTALAGLSVAQIGALASGGVDALDATNDGLFLTMPQLEALGAVELNPGDAIQLTGTGASLAALTLAQLGGLDEAHVDQVNATDDLLSLSLASYQALGTTGVAFSDSLTVTGSSGADSILGHDGVDRLLGAAGNDTLGGAESGDFLVGGNGADQLTGGTGADQFIYSAVGETGTTLSTQDRVLDFEHGVDRLELSAIDANAGVAGNQAFSFITGVQFTAAGQAMFELSGGDTFVRLNTDADSFAEAIIRIVGVQTLTSADLIL